MTEKANRQDTLNYKVEPKDSFGTSLRRERELRSIPLVDVSKATNIQLAYLQALEEDDYDKLPHSTFVRGFIRSYARYIGLNSDNVIANYDHYMTVLSEKTEEKPIEYQNKKKNWLLVTVISTTLFILALLGYYLVVSMQVFKESPPPTKETQTISPSNLAIQPRVTGLIKESSDSKDNSKIQQASPSILPSNPDIQSGDPDLNKKSVDEDDKFKTQPTPSSKPDIQPKGSRLIKESSARKDNLKIQQASPSIPPSNPDIQPGDPDSNKKKVDEKNNRGTQPPPLSQIDIQPEDSGSIKDTVTEENHPIIRSVSPSNLGVQPGDPRQIKEPVDSKDSSMPQPGNHKIISEPQEKEGIPLPPSFSPDL